MRLLKILLTLILFIFSTNFSFAANYSVRNLVLDNSDRMVTIIGNGNFKINQTTSYMPLPSSNSNSINLINNITAYTVTNPSRYIIDIPNAKVSKNIKYEIQNSTVLKEISINQYSNSPEIVRIIFYVQNQNDLSKFKTFSNGKDIIVKYANNIIDNTLQYKFYTSYGDMNKTIKAENLSANIIENNTSLTPVIPKIQTKYYLSQVGQNSDGLILRGLGEISMQKVNYNTDNSKAEIILDNSTLSKKFENKTYIMPTSNQTQRTTLTLNTLNSKKIKLTMQGANLKNYRFVVSPDNQSLFIANKDYVLNTVFAMQNANVISYKAQKNSNNYWILDFIFDKPVVYSVFELNNNFYIDILNLNDYNSTLLSNILKTSEIKFKAMKIKENKMRYIIPLNNLNFSYANIESNSKSIKLCFKEKQINKEITVSNIKENKEIILPTSTKKEIIIPDKPRIVYVAKGEDDNVVKNKKTPIIPTLSSMKKVVIDAGHGGADSGAVRNDLHEKNLNLTIAKLVEKKLKKKNIYVYMTRDNDSTLSLEDRVNFSNEINPNLYVSIHSNATVQEDSYGLEVHYYKEDSYNLARIIHSNFATDNNLKNWNTKDRGMIKSRFYVINHTEAPSVLIEIGFISNPTERASLLTKNRQEEIANSITKGILEYLK